MTTSGSLRDYTLLDALEAIDPVPYDGTVWRVTREGRDPCQCSRTGGRWDDASFDVLYTSEEKNGAIAEMHFHLERGQPIFPSQVRYTLHELNVTLTQALKLVNLAVLATLKMDIARYGQLSYQEKEAEYPRSQDIAEAAHFLGFDGLIVPSARWDCANVVLFCDSVSADAFREVTDHGRIDWQSWIARNKQAP